MTFDATSVPVICVGDGLGLGDGTADGDAEVAGASGDVAVAAPVVRGTVGVGVEPSTGTNPAPPLGDGCRLAGISEQAMTVAASNAATKGRRPTDQGCYRRRAS